MSDEHKITDKNIGSLVRYCVSMEGTTLTALKTVINEKFQKDDTLGNLTKKIRTNRLRVDELVQIADVLDYEVVIRKKG